MSEVFRTPGVISLQYTFCIRYLVQFQENLELQIEINSDNEINAITLTYAARLGLFIWKTNVGAQKIDKLTLVMYNIVIAQFLIQDKLKGVWFFKEIFLVANISLEGIVEIPFFSFSDVDIWFAKTSDFI